MNLKVLSYNIHKGRAFFSRNSTWDLLHDLFFEVKPDIIFLQEFLHDPKSELLLEKLADDLWPHHSFGQNATMGDFHYGNAILSRFPIQSTLNYDISNHPLERRGLLHARVQPFENFNLHLFCTHLDLTHVGRKIQLRKIKKTLKDITLESDPVLLAGDFNDWKNSLHPEIEKHLETKEAFYSLHGRLMPTSPSIYPVLALDRVYFKGLELKSGKILSNKLLQFKSDHLPIVTEFEVRNT